MSNQRKVQQRKGAGQAKSRRQEVAPPHQEEPVAGPSAGASEVPSTVTGPSLPIEVPSLDGPTAQAEEDVLVVGETPPPAPLVEPSQLAQGIVPQIQPVPSIFEGLGAHVPQALRDKVTSGQFVDMSSLLQSAQ